MSRIYAASNSGAPVIRPIPPRNPGPKRTVRIAANVPMPLLVQASIGFSEPSGPKGSKLLLEGAMVLPGISAMLTFARASAEEPTGESLACEVMLLGPGEWLVASTSTAPARIARNSPLQVQIRDSTGSPLAEACHLRGREDQSRRFELSIRVPATLIAEVTTDDFPSETGTHATVGGKMVFGRGILVHCIFGEERDSRGGSSLQVSKADMVAIEVGQTLRFPDQSVELGAPAASLRRMVFHDGHGSPFTGQEHPSSA